MERYGKSKDKASPCCMSLMYIVGLQRYECVKCGKVWTIKEGFA